MTNPKPFGPMKGALLGASIGALVCVVDWMLGRADAFASFPLYGSIGATVLGLVGLGAEENARAARGDEE